MNVHSWFRKLGGRARNSPRRFASTAWRRTRLALEPLEPRWVPSIVLSPSGGSSSDPVLLDIWTVNAAGFSQAFSASGGTAPYNYVITQGAVPGLTLSSQGLLSGTPTAVGAPAFDVTATDKIGNTGNGWFYVEINARPSFAVTSLPNGTVLQPQYVQAIGVNGGTPPNTYAVTAGMLPTGLVLNGFPQYVEIAGRPAAEGSFNFTLTVTDSAGGTGSTNYTVIISGPLLFTTTSLPNWTVSQRYFEPLGASGGTGSNTFAVTAGTLPTGLTLTGAGVISGTPTVVGTYGFTVTATDSSGETASVTYTVTIYPPVAVAPLTLPDWTINQPGYRQTLTTSGGAAPYRVAVSAGSLPTGLSLSTGVLAGTPTVAGSYSFTVTATDSQGNTGSTSYRVVINPPPSITPASLPNWTVNAPGYIQTLTPSGGTAPYNFAVAGGTPPPGLTLADVAGQVGFVFGTPSAVGSYNFTVTATDGVGAKVSSTYTVVINPPVSITTPLLPAWTVNVGFSQLLAASGGTSPYTFSFAGGTLPPGLSVATASGLLGEVLGTPTAVGTYSFTVTATDSTGATGSASYTFIINPPLAITTTSLAAGTANLPGYNQTIAATGGTGPLDFFVPQASLPSGLTLNASTGVLSGTPTAAGTYTFTVAVYDSTLTSVSESYSLVINPPHLAITPTILPNWTIYQPGYSQTLSAADGVAPYTFSETGLLPTGWTLSSSGVLSGTPIHGGTYAFTVTVTDSTSAIASQSYNLIINPPVTITTTTLPGWPRNQPGYSQTLSASGGTGSLTFSLSNTAFYLPPGLVLSSTGVLSGTPIDAGSYTFTVLATDATGAIGGRSFTIDIGSDAMTSSYHVTVQGSSAVQAGSPMLVTVQAVDANGNAVNSYSGPPTATVSVSPTTSGSTFPTTVTFNSSGVGFFGGTLEQVGSYTITVANSSYTGSTTLPVAVTPGTHAQLSFGVEPVNTPTGVTLSTVTVQIEDLFGNVITTDNTDTVTVGIASGPGSFTVGSTTTATAAGGVATFDNLTLVKPGQYSLSEVVTGRYTGSASNMFTVTPLQVLPGSFVGTPSGFSLQLNAPLLVNAMTPAIYGSGFGSSAAVTPTVTLTQTTGTPPAGYTLPYQVPGSLIINTATNALTFVETDTTSMVYNGTPLLADGVYIVYMASSGPNGLQALDNGGGYLDGTYAGTPGHDFTATFTVGTAAAGDDVLWLPATADGPGLPLEAPGKNQAGGGYPVYLSDQTGMVSSVQATLTYDPALLTVTPSSTSTFTVTVPSAGTALLLYNGPALPAGAQTPIGFLQALVPAGTVSNPIPYKARDLLQLSGVSLNGGAVPVVSCEGLHLVAYVGDADGNGAYSSGDAVLLTRVALQTDSGFTAYPLVDPVIIADTDGAGFIPADAALQANEAGVGFPTANLPIPPIPGGVHFQATALHAEGLTSSERVETHPGAQRPGRGQAAALLMDFFVTDRKILDQYFARLENALQD